VNLTVRILLALAITLTAFAQSEGAMPVNPLVQQRADPHVLRHSDGYYYLTATVPEYDRIVLRRSKTIAGLATANEQVIWRRHAQGAMAAHIWAPEIHFIDGKWYVYFTAGRSDDIWAIRLYVLENASTNPFEGTWTEKGQLKTAFESFSLDATTFEHRGQRYLVWTQRPLEPKDAGTDIYIALMRNPWTLELPQISISSPTADWETRGHKVNEAPAVLIRNGRVFVTFSASATDANYCIGLLTADEDANLLERASWKKSSQPVFASSDATGQYGPGHNSFTIAEDGKSDVLVYHARNYRDIKGEPLHDPNRHTRVQALHWKADGTPHFGVPVKDGPVELITTR
jgi:GH43 family beta-xylosidase